MTNVRLQLCCGYSGAHRTGLTVNNHTAGVTGITPINSIKA
ncbi:hypothetical protein ACWDZ4_27080 [Streptomyces sp. NPDC003016]